MPKVLTVDDSRAVRMLVSKNAKEMGLEVDEAEDGQQGLSKVGEESYDLIVLDGDKGYYDESSAPQPVNDLGFIVTAEGNTVDYCDGIVVGGGAKESRCPA